MCLTEPPDEAVRCGECAGLCNDTWYELVKSHELVHFYDDGRLPGLARIDSQVLVSACSPACVVSQIHTTMSRERVHLPSTQPGIRPTEVCAGCRGPVNMAERHMTYSCEKRCWMDAGESGLLGVQFLAVLCPSCEAASLEANPPVRARAVDEIERREAASKGIGKASGRQGVTKTLAHGRKKS